MVQKVGEGCFFFSLAARLFILFYHLSNVQTKDV